jgi:diacylglycerol kinase family enzyme
MTVKRKQLPFQRCVVIVNSASSNYYRGQHLIRQLGELFPNKNFETIEMLESDYKRPSWLITRLNAALRYKTLLAIAGGDGTVNMIVDTLLRSNAITPLARKATIFPLWTGNANDLAHMANGNQPASIEFIIRNGTISTIYPLEVSIRHDFKTTTKLAVCYVSLGASAYASIRISHPSHRRRRIYRVPGARNLTDAASVTQAFIGAPTFESDIDGVRRPIYDLAMINGSRIAKVNRIPMKLTEKSFTKY